MKIRISQKREAGSMLLVTVVISAVIGLALASYLSLIQAQNLSVTRSQNWNSAIPVCESGIEEALAHLNSVGSGNRGTNGWTLANGTYNRTNTISSLRYEVTISPADPPVVTSTGYVPAPLGQGEIARTVRVTTSKQSSGMRGLVAKGAITLGPGSVVDSYDSRITVTYVAGSARSNAFVGAVNGSISGGNIIKGDASTGPGYTISTTVTGGKSDDLSMSFPPVAQPFNGGFSPPANVSVTITNFTIASTPFTTNSVPSPVPAGGVTTNLTVLTNGAPPASGGYSTVSVTMTNTTYPSGVSPVVTNSTYLTGQRDYPAAGTFYGLTTTTTPTRYSYYRIDSYRYSTNMYVYTNKTYTYSVTTTNASSTSTETYAYVLDSDNYKTDSISLSGSQPRNAEMLIRGDAVLWVTEGLTMTGNARITIMPGASLKIYVGDGTGSGSEIKIAGNGVLNQTGDTDKMGIYGLSDTTVVKLAGNGAFIGTVYAPSADLQGKGGGSDTDDFQGAAIVGTVSYNGHFNFHYDEKLGDNNALTQWKIASWTEL
jgi:hypothetical protein